MSTITILFLLLIILIGLRASTDGVVRAVVALILIVAFSPVVAAACRDAAIILAMCRR